MKKFSELIAEAPKVTPKPDSTKAGSKPGSAKPEPVPVDLVIFTPDPNVRVTTSMLKRFLQRRRAKRGY